MKSLAINEFLFQQPNKENGCEDAPPISSQLYSVICDGLGGAGSTKYAGWEKDSSQKTQHTSAYWGSRIVATSVQDFFELNNTNENNRIWATLSSDIDSEQNNKVRQFVDDLKKNIEVDLEQKKEEWDITAPHSRSIKLFPTTLAACVYVPKDDGLRLLSIWAGDSRVYILSPTCGLLQLTQDDSDMSPNDMGSSSAMNNCISYGNSFHLNYSIYDIKEECIIFCCSDGCFDYMPSPLAFEWALIHTILGIEIDDNLDIGSNIERCISVIYEKMGVADDTTMAGISFGINTISMLKSMYQARMNILEPHAMLMMERLKQIKSIESERNKVLKSERLLASKMNRDICTILTNALMTFSPENLYKFLQQQKFYLEYKNSLNHRIVELSERKSQEIDRLNQEINAATNSCRILFRSDYVAASTSIRGGFNPFLFGKNIILSFRRALLHPSLQHFLSSNIWGSGEEYVGFNEHVLKMLDEMDRLLEAKDDRYLNLWNQVYFMNPQFQSQLSARRITSEALDQTLEQIFRNPSGYYYLSPLTIEQIMNRQEKIDAKKRLESTSIDTQVQSKEFIDENVRLLLDFFEADKAHVIDVLLLLSWEELKKLFMFTPIDLDKLKSYQTVKKESITTLETLNLARQNVSSIWQSYKQTYQAFNSIPESCRGVV